MQQLLQRLLEEEVDELLARGRYEWRAAVDAPVGYRNGFGKPRRLSLSNGTMTDGHWRAVEAELKLPAESEAALIVTPMGAMDLAASRALVRSRSPRCSR